MLSFRRQWAIEAEMYLFILHHHAVGHAQRNVRQVVEDAGLNDDGEIDSQFQVRIELP